jgi:hypothetical protein
MSEITEGSWVIYYGGAERYHGAVAMVSDANYDDQGLLYLRFLTYNERVGYEVSGLRGVSPDDVVPINLPRKNSAATTPFMSGLKPEEKVYIVFEGIPRVTHVVEPNLYWNAAAEVEAQAIALAEASGEDATYMVVPKESLQLARTLHKHGYKLYTLQEALKAEWNKNED